MSGQSLRVTRLQERSSDPTSCGGPLKQEQLKGVRKGSPGFHHLTLSFPAQAHLVLMLPLSLRTPGQLPPSDTEIIMKLISAFLSLSWADNGEQELFPFVDCETEVQMCLFSVRMVTQRIGKARPLPPGIIVRIIFIFIEHLLVACHRVSHNGHQSHSLLYIFIFSSNLLNCSLGDKIASGHRHRI